MAEGASHRGDRSGLEVDLRYAASGLRMQVEFRLRAPWTVLFAPSGAGKTTVLRLIAGLERPSQGRVQRTGAGAVVLTDTERGIQVPAHRRGMGFVAQGATLFPHRTVLENVLYGARDRSEAGAVMKMCRVDHLSGARPGEISGGERQRVALARAMMAGRGWLLLLDEPFSGLHADLRDSLIGDLGEWIQRTGTAVLQVTHDLGDVLASGAEVLVMEGGRIAAQGAARAVLAGEMERLERQLRG